MFGSPSLRPWLALLSLMTASLGTLSCQSHAPGHAPVAEQRALPHPQAMSLVLHEEAAIAPRVDWRASAIDRVPMKLTAGDGSGLRLVEVEGTVVIEDPLAFTELHLTFENPESRRREGRFAFDLPADAALSRLAMRIGGRWMEGEVIERQRARKTFESYIHFRPKVDPALLEQSAANRVSARVFPILPHERKQITISYSEPLSLGQDESYRLPLQGLPELDQLDLRVIVKTVNEGPLAAGRSTDASATEQIVEVHERDFAPSRDFVVALDGAGEAGAVRADELVAVRVRPEASSLAAPLDSLTILFDTSASAARGFDAQVDRLGLMLGDLDQLPVRILAFDQELVLVHEGPARAALGPALAALRERRAFGASDLDAALRSDLLREAANPRLLIWSDGVATAGETNPDRLASAALELGIERIDAYASSPTADRDALRALTTAGTRAGVLLGPDLEGAQIAVSLRARGFDGVELAIEGADWSYPNTLEGFAPGDDIVVFASFPEAAPERVRVHFSDPQLPTHEVAALPGAAPLVLRAVARARTKQLQGELDRSENQTQRESLRRHIIELAMDNRLLTKHTALLVLENNSEYRRHGIRRAARTDILVAGNTGVEVRRRGEGQRRRPQAPTPDLAELIAATPTDGMFQSQGMGGGGGAPTDLSSADAARSDHFLATPRTKSELYAMQGPETGEKREIYGGLSGTGGLGLVGTGRGGGGTGEGTIGLGNSGLIGKGGGGSWDSSGLGTGTGSGYGRGAGAGFGGRGKRVPQVRQAKAQVQGSLDKDIIRRIVRAHINEVRSCYNAGLMRDPQLSGRLEVLFVIDGDGKVITSSAPGSTFPDTSVLNCMVKVVRRWKFPKPPGGGSVIVKYPFVLTPDSVTSPSSSWNSSSSSNSGIIGNWGRGNRRGQWTPGSPRNANAARWRGSAQSGRFAEVQAQVAAGQHALALEQAWDWATSQPDDTLALVALGELLEHDGRPQLAARVYGSLIDLHPERADMRRAAGARLERVDAMARMLAIDSYRKALVSRPDQINGHRLLAWALVKGGAYEEGFEVLEQALAVPVPAGRFNGVKALLRQEQRILAAAWLASEQGADPAVVARLSAAGVSPDGEPSLRLVASWETDSTDVDILVTPLGGGKGRRHADVRTGFGPEAWIAKGERTPVAVSARVRYFNRGAMGYAMGTVASVAHDGAGQLSFSEHPFVLMNARGSVELGRIDAR